MGGCSFEDDCEIISPRTLVLVGKTGNGKSATANSILGMKIFQSKRSSSSVTVTSELHLTSLGDGQVINVIDTPGLFDSSLDFEFIGKEIVKCINMAKDGVHAFLVVVSIRSRFSEDEKAAISSLLMLFGTEIYKYMIVVFTGGDELDEDGETLEDYLHQSPEALKETLRVCENRFVLFDNKTKDETKKSNQVQKFLSLVDMVLRKSGGKPYTNEIIKELKDRTKELQEKEISMHDEIFNRTLDMVELKLKDTTMKLEQQLSEERAARVKAEEKAKAAQKKSDKDTTLKLEQQLEEERAARVKAEKDAKAAQRKSNEEKRKLKEKLENAEKIKEELRMQKEEEMRRVEAHWRKREDDFRNQGGCFIL